MTTTYQEQKEAKKQLQQQIKALQVQLKTMPQAERYTPLGTNLYARRKLLKLTQAETGFLLGVTRATLANWEVGISYPSVITLLHVCEVLHCTPNDLLLKKEVILKRGKP